MGKIIVLGIGNQLMMDDGIGIYLATELAKLDRRSNIQYVIGEADIDYSLAQINGARFVIILDAVLMEKEPGEISVISFASLPKQQILPISPHNLHLFDVLYQQQEMTEGVVIGVEPGEIRFYHGLSSILKEKWHQILLDVSQTIEELVMRNNDAGRLPEK